MLYAYFPLGRSALALELEVDFEAEAVKTAVEGF